MYSFFSIPEGQVTGRGCSTKDKVFYKECETHSYGEQVEKMCFCSYFLCNKVAELVNPNFLLIIGATMFCVLLNNHCHVISRRLGNSPGTRKIPLLPSDETDSMTSFACDNAIRPQPRPQSKLLLNRTISQRIRW